MKKHLIAIGLIVTFGACTKLAVDEPKFEVSVQKLRYKVSDTVRFNFEGSVENIVFYSGEPGKNYAFINRKQASGTPQLQFTSTLADAGETNTLRLMASTDFNGNFNPEGVASATWTDITSRARLSTGSANTTSGIIDLSDFKQEKQVFLALKYQGYKHLTLRQPKWTFNTFTLQNVLPDGNKFQLMNTSDIGWSAIDVKNPTTVWFISTTGQPTITGFKTGSTNEDNEDWLITKGVDLNSIAPDLGLSIQDLGTARINSYQHIFKVAGVYDVTIVAFNKSLDQEKKIIKTFQITVEQ